MVRVEEKSAGGWQKREQCGLVLSDGTPADIIVSNTICVPILDVHTEAYSSTSSIKLPGLTLFSREGRKRHSQILN
jgi:hypothetical protein